MQNVKILEKIARCARPKTACCDHHNIAILLSDIKSEDPAKMTHSISDFLRRLRAQEYAKNMPMNRPGGLRMWAEAKFLYSYRWAKSVLWDFDSFGCSSCVRPVLFCGAAGYHLRGIFQASAIGKAVD